MNVGVVYPEYYFIGTSAVVVLTALLLCAGDAVGYDKYTFEKCGKVLLYCLYFTVDPL